MRPSLTVALSTLLLGLAAGCRPGAETKTLPPAAVTATNQGVALMGQYDYDGAAQAFETALAAVPDLADARLNLAFARFNRGKKELQDVEQATALLDAVLAREPANPRALYFKGIVLQHQGDAAGAAACFERVLQLRPDDGVAWYLLGLSRQRLGQESAPALLRALELNPYLVSAYYRVWQVLQSAGKPEQAAPYLEKFKQLRESPLAETIELPQYNQMGELALAVPLGGAARPAPTAFAYRPGPAVALVPPATAAPPASARTGLFGGAAVVSSPAAGRADLFLASPAAPLPFHLTLDPAGRAAAPATDPVRPETAGTPLSCAVGDYDNDERPDLFVVGTAGNALFRGAPDGTYSAVSGVIPALPAGAHTRGALWVDADQDGDLDLFLCNDGAPDQLLNNNADGTFTDLAPGTALARPASDSLMVLPGDLDRDRDLDLVLLRAGAPALVLLNQLNGKFLVAPPPAGLEIRGDRGGLLQDLDGDGLLDLLVLGGQPVELRLFRGDGRGGFTPAPALGAPANDLRGFRAADADLDGDLDLALFDSTHGHLLRNDGAGRFTTARAVWAASAGNEIAGAELLDLTGDLVPDLLLLETGAAPQVRLHPGTVTPASTAVAFAPSGVRSRDKRTRSPASGYGVAITVRAGQHEQSRLASGQNGGPNQFPAPLVFGLAGAPTADYARFVWPDAVVQIERALPVGRVHPVTEVQRKISSCPVLFTWNGTEYEFITDFAGIGGLGYLAAPGEYTYPQPVDHVRIAPHQLRPRNGFYELRVTEPMEESAYLDFLELVAIDHPADWLVFSDERLTVTGPAPTRELLAIDRPFYPLRAVGPAGRDCTDALRAVDRHYAYHPELDRRFCGFAQRHTIELDFGEQLAALPPGQRVFLFLTGFLEYPYSQTTYAASQAGLLWEPIRIDRQEPDGSWRTIVPDAGALSGMSRTMTADLTGLLAGPSCRLRLTTNLEIYYDQILLGAPRPLPPETVRRLPLATADLRYLGIAREFSPDGRDPLLYDYQQILQDVPFDSLRGAYTRYGPVRELLEKSDDSFVLLATGDELALQFDAAGLPALSPDTARTFILVSHAYCKDMDLYTGTPQTLEPMPFRTMRRYPYPPAERPAETPEQRRLRELYHTRIIP